MLRSRLLKAAAVTALLLFISPVAAFAQLESKFASHIPGLNIPNANLVSTPADAGRVIRGSNPLGKAQALKQFGVTDVLIFKNQIRNEVAREEQELQSAGFPHNHIYAVPFKWRQIGSFQEACLQTVKSLKAIFFINQMQGRSIYFHCTVGEDRTGYLAGLYRMVAQGWSAEQAFRNEMCAHGYEAGDGKKPALTVKEIRAELTPLFVKMATLVARGIINRNNLVPAACGQEPPLPPDLSQFQCQPVPFN